MRIDRLEISTVTVSGAIVRWRSSQPADFVAVCSVARDKNRIQAKIETIKDKYHQAAFEGLEPGTDYNLEIIDPKGRFATEFARFATLSRPPGDLLFSFATVNDIHIGEKEYGLIMLPGIPFALTPGFKLDIDGSPFWKFTNEAAFAELAAQKPEFVIVKGDLNTEPDEESMLEAKRMLDALPMPYYVLRGNHDRKGKCPEDWFGKVFRADTVQSFEHKGAGFILIDAIHPDSGYTCFREEDLARLAAGLKRMKDIPVFIYLHNPPLKLIERSFVNRISKFLAILDTHPLIAGVFYGHSHANKRQSRRLGGRAVPFVETAATMDYPGGYNIYDIYSGGYTQICLRPFEARCLRWLEMTEKAYYGLATDALFGKIEDRNFSVGY